MPDPLEFPRTLCSVIMLVRRKRFPCFWRGIVDEFVALSLRHAIRSGGRFAWRRSWLMPGLAAVIRALDDLPKPAAGLRGINAVRFNGRAFEVIHLPARKVWTADVPLFARSVRRENERALSCSHKYSYLAHRLLLPIGLL